MRPQASHGSRALGADVAGRLGWVGVLIDASGFVGVTLGDLADLIAWAEPVAVVGVDIPLGVTNEARAADAEARAFVGPRRSSVFNSPPTDALACSTLLEANTLLASSGRPKMSAQSWALRAKVLEAAPLAAADDRLIEVHPEASFAELAGRPLQTRKKSWDGQAERRRLLAEAGVRLPDDIGPAGAVPVDDVLDAAAAAWSARRRAEGVAVPMPADAAIDVNGRRLAIWR